MTGPALTRVRIHAAGGFSQRLAEREDRSLRQLMTELEIPPLRRANRFISLAVIGATLCRRNLAGDPPEATGIYVGSSQGSLVDTLGIINAQADDDAAVTPFRFVNVLSNMAGFHVAARQGLSRQNLTVSRLHGPFDAALETALLDLALGQVERALVGGVDEGDENIELHRRRTRTPACREPGEGAGWLLLGRDETAQGRGRLTHLGDLARWADVRERLGFLGSATITAGPHIWHRPDSLKKAFPTRRVWDYHRDFGFSPTGPALAFAHHVNEGSGRLVHIDRTGPRGSWRLWLVESDR